MDIYTARIDFISPPDAFSENVISFKKGEAFEILETNNLKQKSWWGVRALRDDTIGFVPAKFLQPEDKTVPSFMPEDVQSRRQANLQTLAELQKRANFRHPEHVYPNMIPEPDYSDSEEDGLNSQRNGHSDNLIAPKKLHNPCMESAERQKIHKELLFNQKIGKNVLGQKSELEKVMQKKQEDQRKKEWDASNKTKKTDFEVELDKQAQKLKMAEEMSAKAASSNSQDQPEFFRVHAKVKSKSSSSDT